MSSVTNVLGNSVLLVRYKPRFANKKPKRDEFYTDEDFKRAYSVQTVGCWINIKSIRYN
jgi:hypothetical protein